MSVAAHLHIRLEDYDHRVRTFIPRYAEMLDCAAGALKTALGKRRHPTIVDLGIGTGALARRCLDAVPGAALIGIDSDADILRVAMRRLANSGHAVTLIRADLARVPLPAADAIVATLALHHIRTATPKAAFYRRCFKALSPGGVLVSGDCCPASVRTLAAEQHLEWIAHLERSYEKRDVRRFLRAWADEDTYMPLEKELEMIRRARFSVEVVWRRGAFAVIVGMKR